MRSLLRIYDKLTPLLRYGQSLLLLFVRLYWGWQFAQNGWGKLHHLGKITEYFQSINVPAPGATAHMVATLEFVGGILLFIGLFSRLIAFPMTINMIMAYWFGDHEALLSVFSDPGKFYGADPYTFLFAVLLILLFGPGLFSLDALLMRRFRDDRFHFSRV